MRVREIDVASPDPSGPVGVLGEVAQRDRLRVVRQHDVGVHELSRVLTRDVEEELLLALREIELHPLQRVVDLLGDVVEGRRRVENGPVRIHARVAEERHEVLQDFGDAAPVRSGVDVQHAAALRRLRERLQLLVALVADDLLIIGQSLGRGDRNCVHY